LREIIKTTVRAFQRGEISFAQKRLSFLEITVKKKNAPGKVFAYIRAHSSILGVFFFLEEERILKE